MQNNVWQTTWIQKQFKKEKTYLKRIFKTANSIFFMMKTQFDMQWHKLSAKENQIIAQVTQGYMESARASADGNSPLQAADAANQQKK